MILRRINLYHNVLLNFIHHTEYTLYTVVTLQVTVEVTVLKHSKHCTQGDGSFVSSQILKGRLHL